MATWLQDLISHAALQNRIPHKPFVEKCLFLTLPVLDTNHGHADWFNSKLEASRAYLC